MADPVLHTANASATNATNYVTASVTIPANDLAFAYVATETTTPAPTLTDASRTWVLVDSQALPAFGTLYLFRSLVGSQTTGAITIDFGATTAANCTWVVGSKDNVDTSGTHGSGAIGLVAKTNGASTAPTVTFGSAFSNANHPTIGGFNINSNFRTLTPGTGWTQLTVMEEAAEDVEILVEYKLVEDSTVEANIGASSDNFAAIAFEVNTLPEPITVTAGSVDVAVGPASSTPLAGVVTAAANSQTVLVSAQAAAANSAGVITVTPNAATVVTAVTVATVVTAVTVTAGGPTLTLAAQPTVEQVYAEAFPIPIAVFANPAVALTVPNLTVTASAASVVVVANAASVVGSVTVPAGPVPVAMTAQNAAASVDIPWRRFGGSTSSGSSFEGR